MIIKRIDVLSAGKIAGIIAAAIGLIAGLLFLLFGGLLSGLAGQGQGGGMLAMGGGLLGVIVLPILYGVFGFIGGVVQAFIYNIAAGFVGGIRIETE
ncbi:hypothetical protein [Luteimonas mephitis]|jgi:hypothetical protein|uniref:hypothetical protein n=1 Tax=Luteimonas mephitis TaxID=83615 RepID=UPI003A941508